MTLRIQFSDSEIAKAYADNKSYAKGAKALTALGKGTVYPQLFRYWVSTLDASMFNAKEDVFSTREVIRAQNLSSDNNMLRKQIRNLSAENTILRDFYTGIKAAPHCKIDLVRPIKILDKHITLELLFSDLQIGKMSSNYSSDIAKRRVTEYTRAAILKIQQYAEIGYTIDRIVVAILGDVIESDKKHGIQSARGTDSGTATQMVNAHYVLVNMLSKLASLGIPMDVHCVTGNHDHDGHGLFMVDSGKEHLSWCFYNTVKHAIGLTYKDLVRFTIPTGVFSVENIYGYNIVYEHGVGVAVTAAAMEARRNQRAQQVGKHISMFRMGDKHNITRFNNDSLIVNGAFFGTDPTGGEYSSIVGYNSLPAQLMLCHVNRADGDVRSTLFDTFVIQLSHIQ